MKKAFQPTSAAKKCAEILNNLQFGNSLYEEIINLKNKSDLTNYTKSQIMYTLILTYLETTDVPTDELTMPAFIFILEWRKEILLNGLFNNALIPDDCEMEKILSRPSWTKNRLWEAQGHTHRTDGMPLLKRIYAIHEQIK